MDFTLNEEQQMFGQMFGDFMAKEVAPRAEAIDAEGETPSELLEQAAMQGFLGAILPEDYMGAALDMTSYTLLAEAWGRADLSSATVFHAHMMTAMAILAHGTEDQKATYLEAMAMGEKLGAFALTEPAAGSDPAGMLTEAKPDGSDYLLNGVKSWVTNAGRAGTYVVFARAPEGVTGFIVDADTPGLKVGGREKTLGLRGAEIRALYLDHARVPAANVLGKVGHGLRVALSTMDFAHLSLAALTLGGAEQALDLGVQFASERKQFGVLIAKKQAIQNYLADAKLKIEALRHLIEHASWLAVQGKPYSFEATMAKLYGGQAIYETANTMIQVHGGYGYIVDYPISRLYRDARAMSIIGGSAEIQRVLVARHVLAEAGIEVKP